MGWEVTDGRASKHKNNEYIFLILQIDKASAFTNSFHVTPRSTELLDTDIHRVLYTLEKLLGCEETTFNLQDYHFQKGTTKQNYTSNPLLPMTYRK